MKRLFCILASVALFSSPALFAADDDLAVVVNKSNSVQNLTKGQLRKLLLGEQGTWPGGKSVNLILRAPGQPERQGVLRSVCSMSEDDFNQQLLHASFNGGTSVPPKSLASAVAVRQLVMSLPGGIGFLKVADVNDSVKTVTVDGLSAGQAGYKVKAGN